MTSLRRIHREPLGFAPLVAGTADAAVTTPLLLPGVAGIGLKSVP